ncbi:hypothetical protein H6776_02565 [Candidatus Nomurabacteria bacterium]|nr:hypothetical protein [Candidatus Nomurabacteria bacterium]
MKTKEKKKDSIRIMWYSAHQPHRLEITELKKIFGVDVVIDIHGSGHTKRNYLSAKSIVQTFKDGNYDEILMIAPLSVIQAVLDLGVQPLKARVEQLSGPGKHDFEYMGRYFKFLTPMFERVQEIQIIAEPIYEFQIISLDNIFILPEVFYNWKQKSLDFVLTIKDDCERLGISLQKSVDSEETLILYPDGKAAIAIIMPYSVDGEKRIFKMPLQEHQWSWKE